jgi:hypothetical protein
MKKLGYLNSYLYKSLGLPGAQPKNISVVDPLNADQDPESQTNADPCGSGSGSGSESWSDFKVTKS